MEITEKETTVHRTASSAVAELDSPGNETPQGLPVPGNESAPATARKLRLVVVEDNPSDVELVKYALKKGAFDAECTVVQTAEDFRNALHGNGYEIVLADYSLPAWNGLETVEVLRQEGLDVPVIVVSGALGDMRAVECIKQGAADYVLKDHLLRLPDAVWRALREKKLRDDNRQAEEELARSNRDLEQFAYVASHDLQEPLRMVATYTQLLAERYQGKLDENADKYIHYAVDGAMRMQTLVQDLLAFSRVGREGNIAILVDVNLAVQAALINLQGTIQDSNAQVQFGELPSIVAEQSQLTQLFQNLISNAIKFRGKEPPRITISAEKRDREWVLSVADNGIGIAPEYAETIFVIFKRLHTQEEYAGSGIGLAICKKVVEQHSGRIWMESEPGKGSTFKVALPVRRA
jgi:signal transduction histidine kinase